MSTRPRQQTRRRIRLTLDQQAAKLVYCTGELLVGPAKTLFLDEISTGLDSSTTFQIMRSLRHFAHIRQATLLVALLQPTPETYHLFDDIMLLSEGKIIYCLKHMLMICCYHKAIIR